MKIKSLKCPKENGGCGKDDAWIVALDKRYRRFVMDCGNCGYRHSFPLDVGRIDPNWTGPIDESGQEIHS